MSNSESFSTVRRRAPVSRAECALAQAAEEIGDRWSLLILREAFFDVMRYDDIRQDLLIPRSVLTDRLGKLLDRGLIQKQPYQECGDRRRYGYALTQKGRALAHAFIALTHWSEDYVLRRPGPIEIVDGTTGRKLRLALLDEQGEEVHSDKVAPHLREGWAGEAGNTAF